MIKIKDLIIQKINVNKELTNKNEVIDFLHKYLGKYTDTKEAIEKAIDYALSDEKNKGGFLLITLFEKKIVGAAVITKTNMEKFIPENILVYIAVNSDLRGKGIGSKMIKKIKEECKGDIKLHVDFDNPASNLYEKYGFKKKYIDMRLNNGKTNSKS